MLFEALSVCLSLSPLLRLLLEVLLLVLVALLLAPSCMEEAELCVASTATSVASVCSSLSCALRLSLILPAEVAGRLRRRAREAACVPSPSSCRWRVCE